MVFEVLKVLSMQCCSDCSLGPGQHMVSGNYSLPKQESFTLTWTFECFGSVIAAIGFFYIIVDALDVGFSYYQTAVLISCSVHACEPRTLCTFYTVL